MKFERGGCLKVKTISGNQNLNAIVDLYIVVIVGVTF